MSSDTRVTVEDLAYDMADAHGISLAAAREGVRTYLGQINDIDHTRWDVDMDEAAADAIRESFAAYYADADEGATIRIYEDNAGGLILADDTAAWNLGYEGEPGGAEEDARTWRDGYWEPSDSCGQTRLDVTPDDLYSESQDAGRGDRVRLIAELNGSGWVTMPDRCGAAGARYLGVNI